ncbi:low molecular weight protein-tyrosine-phosphatase [Stappia sp. TSB10GB4]|uniref:low molecular weight protein-tyrosine-phosphatase n=1 Tax=Stappia sp. TSB10GB4 TaxID=2003584 RepID=UPI0016460016|nr:low molecular weight protein-tyrosine-phosphatase [Stappia sp. TSB10GB4]
MTAILFVCLGNICRSPLAEGILRQRIEAAGLGGSVTVDSAGTASWHIGKAPDPRSVAVAARNGIDLSRLRARQVSDADYTRFNLILAMDSDNLADLQARAPTGCRAEIRRFLPHDVPDPYYGGPNGFDAVFRMLDQGCHDLIARETAKL